MAVIEETRPETLEEADEDIHLRTEMELGRLDGFLHDPSQGELRIKAPDGKTLEKMFPAIYEEIGVSPPAPRWAKLGENGEYGRYSVVTLPSTVRQLSENEFTAFALTVQLVEEPSGEPKGLLVFDRFLFPHGKINGVSSDQVDLARTAA